MRNRKVKFTAFIFLFVLSFAAVLCIGRFPLTVNDIRNIITGAETDGIKKSVFLSVRLPRAVFAAVNGAALAVSGYTYQELFRNPLAAPDVLGVSGGACVGAAAAMLAGFSAAAVQISSLAFGLLTVAVTVGLSLLIGRRRTVSLVLAGIVVKAAADAVIMCLKYTADPTGQMAYIDYKLMGSYHTVSWDDVYMLLLFTAIPLGILYFFRWRLQILSLGDEEAKSLGVSSGILRVIIIILATVPVAAGVSVTGIVSWAGLIVPHTVRFFADGNIKKDFGLCIFAGGAFMLWADAAARSLTAAEIPISIITSTVGAAFLLIVLVRKKRRE